MGVIGDLNKEDLKVDHPEVRTVHLGVLTWAVLAVHTGDQCTACPHLDSGVPRGQWADLQWVVHTEARLWVAHLQDLCLHQVSCKSSNFNR